MNITTVATHQTSMPEASLYHSAIIHHKVVLPFAAIQSFKSIQELLIQYASDQIAGKCITEGFIKPQSCVLRSQSVGTLSAGNIAFNLEIECMLCCPKEGDVMKCVAKTVTQAGIRAHASMEPSPVVVYISRDVQDCQSRTMDSVKPGDHILIRVIGKRYELNDKHVSIIGEWMSI